MIENLRDPEELQGLTFVRDKGRPDNGTADLISAACILSGEARLDGPRATESQRVSPEIRAYAISVNDWFPWRDDEERTKYLRPFAPLLLDTVAMADVVYRRLWLAADRSVRAFAPLLLDLDWPVYGGKLRALAEVNSVTAAASERELDACSRVVHMTKADWNNVTGLRRQAAIVGCMRARGALFGANIHDFFATFAAARTFEMADDALHDDARTLVLELLLDLTRIR